MAVVLTIAGVTKTFRAGSLRITEMANGRATASFDIVSVTGSYRPAQDAEVIITDGGSRIFAGLIDQPTERGTAMGATSDIITTVDAVDFHRYAERRAVRETFTAGTLKSYLTTLVTNYLSTFGVTLHASQVNGPTLPDLIFDLDRPLNEVLDDLSNLTANYGEQYVWRIDYTKVLRMYQPSTQTATFNISEGSSGNAIFDLTVSKTRQYYANTIILNVPQRAQANRTETFTATAGQTLFTLWYSVTSHLGTINVTRSGVTTTETVSETPGAADWYLLRTITTQQQDTLTRNLGGLSAGDTVAFTFDGMLRARFISTDAAEVASVGAWERVEIVEDLPSLAAGQALCDAFLEQAVQLTKEIRYKTLQSGLVAGMQQTFTSTKRALSGVTAIITDIVTTDYGKDRLLREVTANTGTIARPNWRQVMVDWFGDQIGSGGVLSSTAAGTATVSVVGPALPVDSVQFHRSGGTFGGVDRFTFDETTNGFKCGGTGNTIAVPGDAFAIFGRGNQAG